MPPQHYHYQVMRSVASSYRALLLLLAAPAAAHVRWQCPTPRSSDTGIKAGPCGSDTNDFSISGEDELQTIEPGPFRVVFEESVFHTGAPFRIALSGDGSDSDASTCVLLDHIPHNDNVPTRPFIYNPSSYIPYAITVEIPDVACEQCSLLLVNPMTDKIGVDGAPNGQGCTDPNGTCFSVYHSCTLPFRIAGSTPRSEYVCPAALPDDWPLNWTGDEGVAVDASTPGVYRREASVWELDDEEEFYLLQTVPSRYRQDVGSLCSDATGLPTMSPTESLDNLLPTAQPRFSNAPAIDGVPSKTPKTMIPSVPSNPINSLSNSPSVSQGPMPGAASSLSLLPTVGGTTDSPRDESLVSSASASFHTRINKISWLVIMLGSFFG